MAYLTQYSSSIPIIKFHIDQMLMTIGKDIEMDICVPEDGVASTHATVEAIQNNNSYRFIVKSEKNESSLDLNGNSVALAELSDGDWINIGGVEFQFTDDGVYSFKEPVASIPDKCSTKEEAQIDSPNKGAAALKLVKELKEELQEELKEELKPMTTKEFIANSRQSRRRLAF